MAKSTIPITEGFDYQARWFWIQATRLFRPDTKVVQVDYEANSPRGFDDVIVHYNPPIKDEFDKPVHMDCFQLKFHVCKNGAFTYESLMDPKFIGAKSNSLLKKLLKEQKVASSSGKDCRFHIVSPWVVNPNDPLGEICSNYEDEVRLGKLFNENRFAQVRRSWCEHLDVTEDELQSILSQLRIISNSGSLKRLNDELNVRLQCAGLKPVEDGMYNCYDDIIRKLQQKGLVEFDKDNLQKICQEQGLWIGLPEYDSKAVTILGVRSFSRWAEYIEDETNNYICLLRHFDGRRILDPSLWNAEILPGLADFLESNIRKGKSYHLYLEAHSSIAFAAGYCLDPKCGADIAPIQNTSRGSCPWVVDCAEPVDPHSLWAIVDTKLSGCGSDIALAVSVTHDVSKDAAEYVHKLLPAVGQIVECTVRPITGAMSVRDGKHAFQLADSLATVIRKYAPVMDNGTLHIFAAAPNGLMFFLGRHAHSFGQCVLYEYDFDRMKIGGYEPSIMFGKRK